MKLPHLIIAGVNKAGTTSIFAYLAGHPDVCASSIKETCFFLPARYGLQVEELSVYDNYFAHCPADSFRIESTPGYFYGGATIAQYIKDNVPGVKIVLVFRNPVDRLLSFYKFKQSELELPASMSLSEYLDKCASFSDADLNLQENNVYTGLINGEYYRQMQGWFDVFGADCKVVFFDDMKQDVNGFMVELSDWLGISSQHFVDSKLGVENKTVNYKNRTLQRIALGVNKAGERVFRANPGLKKRIRSLYYAINGKPFNRDTSPGDVQRLNDHYAEPNAKLATMLQEHGYSNLPAWLPKSATQV